jgi:hypothetical protein
MSSGYVIKKYESRVFILPEGGQVLVALYIDGTVKIMTRERRSATWGQPISEAEEYR